MDIYTQLMRDEGIRHKMYKDSVGIETIGVGHNLQAKAISQRAVEVILEDDVQDTIKELHAALPWVKDLSDARRGVLINMAFNLGIKGLLSFKNTLKAIQEGRWEDARKGILDSKYAQQVGPRAHRLGLQLVTDRWV